MGEICLDLKARRERETSINIAQSRYGQVRESNHSESNETAFPASMCSQFTRPESTSMLHPCSSLMASGTVLATD